MVIVFIISSTLAMVTRSARAWTFSGERLTKNVHVRVMPLPRAVAVRLRGYGFTMLRSPRQGLGLNLIALSRMTSIGSAPVLDTGSRYRRHTIIASSSAAMPAQPGSPIHFSG